MNILNNKKLNLEHSMSLKNHSLIKNKELKQIEEQAKVSIKNNSTITNRGNASINPSEIKVNVTGEMAHFNFIKDMDELSLDEKRKIDMLIKKSIEKPKGGTGDYFVMDRAQTNAQLQLIADKLIPEKYKDQMNKAIKSYQEDGLNFQVKIYEAAQERMDKLSSKYPTLGKKTIATTGIKTLQEQEKKMVGSYNQLDLSSQSNFVQSFETILTNFKENQLQLKNSPEDVLNQFQDELRAKWNDFATLFNDSKIYKHPTVNNSVIDVRL